MRKIFAALLAAVALVGALAVTVAPVDEDVRAGVIWSRYVH